MKRNPIYVTQSFLPPIDEYEKFIERIWNNHYLTNHGPILREFEEGLSGYLGVDNLHFVSNGTIALQVALNALGITDGEVITTPFSYVATISSMLWERCKPVFVDIDPETYCMDATKIEDVITKDTRAIMPVHVFGNPCDVELIESIAKKHNIKTIYDGAHAFGAEYKGKSLLSYGDISTCSFHATKLFHTVEGGLIVVKDKEVSYKVELIKRFGHYGDDHQMPGINAKSSEFHAAMGLVNLKYIDEIIEKRKNITDIYDKILSSHIERQVIMNDTKYNYAYYPVVMDSEEATMSIIKNLEALNIFPRRYFFPSLNELKYLEDKQDCPVSEDISTRILCLPLYSDLDPSDAKLIAETVLKSL